MQNQNINQLILHCHQLVDQFAQDTDALDVSVIETKRTVQWTLLYKIHKLQFVYTKKEYGSIPLSTMYCRVYVMKNDKVYFFIPELLDYFEDKNNQTSYSVPYIESTDTLDSYFQNVLTFFQSYKESLTAVALDPKRSHDLEFRKKVGLYLTMHKNDTTLKKWNQFLEMLDFALEYYECFIAIPISNKRTQPTNEIEKLNSGKLFFFGSLLGTVLFGLGFTGILLLANHILSTGTTLYYGCPWYYGFLFGGLPGLFWGIVSYRKNARRLYRNNPDFLQAEKNFQDSKGELIFGRITFWGAFLFSSVLFVTCILANSRFYEDRVVFNHGEELLSFQNTTGTYENLETIIYTEGIYNDWDEFIHRPSYLLVFSDGLVWDSDSFTSVEAFTEEILPLIKPYCNTIQQEHARNKYIE